MDWDYDELERYEEYCNFVRRKMVDDLDLKIDNIMSIDFNSIEDRGNIWIHIFSLYPDYKNVEYNCMSYGEWNRIILLQKKRESRLSSLLGEYKK